MPSTLLVIDDITISDYASRGIRMSLQPTGSGQLDRDVNGTLHDLTLSQFRKRRAVISCDDQEAPVFTNVWPGKTVQVTLIPELGVGTITLTMMVEEWEVNRDEWGAATDWQLSLIEV